MTAPSDAHRRAKLRGQAAVAQWRMKSAVWAGRVLALVLAGTVIVNESMKAKAHDWFGSGVVLALAGCIAIAAWRVASGRRAAAVTLDCLFLLIKSLSWAGGESIFQGALFSIVLLGCFGSGIWGTFALAIVERDTMAMSRTVAPPMDAAPETNSEIAS